MNTMCPVAGLASLSSPLPPGVVVMTTRGTPSDGRAVGLAAYRYMHVLIIKKYTLGLSALYLEPEPIPNRRNAVSL